jgi:hypothetical protein
MICYTNADYYAPEPPTIRTADPEPFSDGDIASLIRDIDAGYRRFLSARCLQPVRAPFFLRNHKKTHEQT